MLARMTDTARTIQQRSTATIFVHKQVRQTDIRSVLDNLTQLCPKFIRIFLLRNLVKIDTANSGSGLYLFTLGNILRTRKVSRRANPFLLLR